MAPVVLISCVKAIEEETRNERDVRSIHNEDNHDDSNTFFAWLILGCNDPKRSTQLWETVPNRMPTRNPRVRSKRIREKDLWDNNTQNILYISNSFESLEMCSVQKYLTGQGPPDLRCWLNFGYVFPRSDEKKIPFPGELPIQILDVHISMQTDIHRILKLKKWTCCSLSFTNVCSFEFFYLFTYTATLRSHERTKHRNTEKQRNGKKEDISYWGYYYTINEWMNELSQ